MPRTSKKAELLQKIEELANKTSQARQKYIQCCDWLEHDSEMDSSSGESALLITPPSPISPLLSDVESDISDDLTTSLELRDAHYCRFLHAICALYDEVQKAQVITSANPQKCARV